MIVRPKSAGRHEGAILNCASRESREVSAQACDMAEIKPMALIESMKKKVCEHSDVYFRTNKRTGKVTTGKLCNPSDKEPSEAQVKAQSRFKKVAAAVRALLADPEQKSKLEAEYNAQNKYGSLFGYAMHKLNGNYDENGDPIE